MYDDQCNILNSIIRDAKQKICSIKISEKEHEDELAKSHEDKKLCKNIYENICDRFINLETKCSMQIDTLSDSHVLEVKNEFRAEI